LLLKRYIFVIFIYTPQQYLALCFWFWLFFGFFVTIYKELTI